MPHLSTEIANEFLKQKGALGAVTQMQLQKLVYIAHGWNLAVNDEPLASDAVKSWRYGPVFPLLYDHAKYFGSSPIPRLITALDNNGIVFFFEGGKEAIPYSAQFSNEESEVIRRVWDRYSKYSAFNLSDMTHRPGTPWFETYFNEGPNNAINNEKIKHHYRELAARVQ